MKSLATLTSSLLLASSMLLSAVTHAAAAADIRLWRLDCGTLRIDKLDDYSDTYAYVGKSSQFVVSCYLVKHDDTYMLWDTGLSTEDLGLPLRGEGSKGESLAKSIDDQLALIGVDAKQIAIVAISHSDFDHTGQASHFPQARLLMGRGDIQALRRPGNPDAKALAHWIGGDGTVEEVSGDRDIFKDRSVVMLDLPGHTPGHHGLLVKLPRMGYVLLSGDVAHFRQNYDTNGVPWFNDNRADSLASLDRFKTIAKNLKATAVIQHEAADVNKLPRFPAFAQ